MFKLIYSELGVLAASLPQTRTRTDAPYPIRSSPELPHLARHHDTYPYSYCVVFWHLARSFRR